MRRLMYCALAALVVLLIAAGVYVALQQEDSPTVNGSSAALGIMLTDGSEGLYVLAVTRNSPADKAGVQPGDYVLQAGDEELMDAEHLDECLEKSGSDVTLTLLRKGTEVQVTLSAR